MLRRFSTHNVSVVVEPCSTIQIPADMFVLVAFALLLLPFVVLISKS